MFVVITNVQLKPGKIEAALDLFAQTNPALVEDEADWLEAKFTANRDENQVTVLAFWRSADAYLRFSSSDKFRQAMAQFAPFFIKPPEVNINEILFEM